ncbi:MAG: flagellar filament capping protein FliD [Candidatus Sumerlaeota bacterium]|nr:flagellar filament capping protein FliD [Candidatus Sumerlaeota bacterium]
MALSVGTGLISGINYEDLITRLMNVERQPITDQETRRTALQTQQQAYQDINLRLNALRDAMAQIDSALDFSSKQTSVSDTSALSASANSSAPDGSFNIDILQLAANERRASQGVATQDSTAIAAGDGTFQFRLGPEGSAVASITVSATTTLSELRDAINNAQAGVTATIVNDGTPTNPYRLMLIGNDTGAAHAIAIVHNDTTLDFDHPVIEDAVAQAGNAYTGQLTVSSENGYNGEATRNVVIEVTSAGAIGQAKFRVSLDGGVTWSARDAYTATAEAQDIAGGEDVRVAFGDNGSTLGVGDKFTIDAFNPVLQRAQDAIVRLDGITLNRSANTMTDVVPGMTLTAQKVSTTPARVSVSTDKTGMADKINAFVTAYNALVSDLRSQGSYDVSAQKGGPLFGDSAIRGLSTALGDIVTSGIDTAQGKFTLASIGISMQRAQNADGTSGGFDGTLGVDQTALSQAIQNNYDQVKKLFALVGESDNQSVAFISASNAVAPGSYFVYISQAATRAEIASGQVVPPAGLAQAESLTFTVGTHQYRINLDQGAKIGDIVERLNSVFQQSKVGLETVDRSGELVVRSKDYGSKQSFSVVSNRGAAGQTGIGQTLRGATGSDVAGTINGHAAVGEGQILRGASNTDLAGLRLLAAGASSTSATMTVSRGAASQALGLIEQYTNSSNGVLTLRSHGLDQSIKDINDRIQTLEDRMTAREESYRQQFTHLETILAQYQSQSEFLTNQLAQLTGQSSSSN